MQFAAQRDKVELSSINYWAFRKLNIDSWLISNSWYFRFVRWMNLSPSSSGDFRGLISKSFLSSFQKAGHLNKKQLLKSYTNGIDHGPAGYKPIEGKGKKGVVLLLPKIAFPCSRRTTNMLETVCINLEELSGESLKVWACPALGSARRRSWTKHRL